MGPASPRGFPPSCPAPPDLPPCPDGASSYACSFGRIAAIALYEMRVSEASNTIGLQMNGARVTYTLGDDGLVFSDTFRPGSALEATSHLLANGAEVPEPETWYMLVAGLILLALGRGSKPSKASR